ncbi:MAG: UDP-glucose 4-epimerase GalE [Lachnospiraceae bacterium]|nr:UDP-glucose 4-epimerase GalE [Lachnospiraceae bacterium]
MAILVTGGAGYIGSHTCVELIEAGYEPIIVDNLYNSSREAIKRVEEITGKTLTFYEADLLDQDAIDAIFAKHEIESVIHFAGYKAVGESVAKPIEYYHNNITGTLMLCDVMRKHNVKNLVFSSSATVYGDPEKLPITEDLKTGGVTNPYGQTKFMIEQILQDIYVSDPAWNIILLRYFNPIGAHASGKIGEDPNGIPNNLVPYVAQVAVGKLEKIHVFGDDYDTVDGTGVRDYIHVVDLAKGHVKALEKIESMRKDGQSGVNVYNLGTGNGSSVLQVIHAFEKACGKELAYVVDARRPGDIAACYADATKAYNELHWKAEKTIADMCADSWRWQSNNPNGYK